MKHKVFLGTGSNIGDRLAGLQHAARALQEMCQGGTAVKCIRNTALGLHRSAGFLNQVLKATTELDPLIFWRKLIIETDMDAPPPFVMDHASSTSTFFSLMIWSCDERLTIPTPALLKGRS